MEIMVMNKIKSSAFAKLCLMVIFIVMVFSTVTNAATYYVRTDGINTNTGLANSPGSAWRSIDYAADRVSPGDVVRIQAGTYSEWVTPGHNGTGVDSTITLVADGDVTVCGFDFNNSSYIRVIGFIIDTTAGSCIKNNACVYLGGTNSYLEFWNNTLRNANYNGIRIGLSDTINNSIILGNTFYNFGVGNGSGVAIASRGDNNLIAYNEIYNIHPDAMVMFGSNNRWLNNYIHDLSEASGGHSDVFQTGSSVNGWSYNLIEANFQSGMGNTGDEHSAQISNSQASTFCTNGCGIMTENIFRRNIWYNASSGTVGINQVTDGGITFIRYYNNTAIQSQRNYPTATRGLSWYGTLINDVYLINNIEYESWGKSVSSNIDVYCFGATSSCGLDYKYTLDYNLAYDPDGSVAFTAPWTYQAHPRSNVNPYLNDIRNGDFHLQSGSGAKGTGGPLTTTRGSGTGTTFHVATDGGGFFRGSNASISQYGGKLAAGDMIRVGSKTLTVSSVSGDAITVTESFSWTDGQNIYFGSSSSPDIGAFPYRSDGFSLTGSYIQSGNMATINPSSSDLVRFVVCYEDGIPTTVANSGPYACSVGSGSLDVRIYPLYASKTLFVVATYGDAPPIPTNLRIMQ